MSKGKCTAVTADSQRKFLKRADECIGLLLSMLLKQPGLGAREPCEPHGNAS